MKVAFWGKSPGRASVSSNLLAVSTMASLKYKVPLMVMQAHFDVNRLEYAFMPMSSVVCMKEDFAYYRRRGIDEIIDGLRMNRGGFCVENSLVKVENSLISYLPSTSETTKELYEKACNPLVNRIVDVVSASETPVFVDCRDASDLLSECILQNADVLVVSIEQGSHPIPKELFENKELMERCIFLIGRYDSQSIYNIRNIRRKYHIDKECIAAIPYNVEFRDSICEGKIVDFFKENLSCKKYEDNYEFINGVTFASSLILRKAGINVGA